MKKLKYSDLYEGQKVYVEYEREGCVWSEEARGFITDGVETVHKNENNVLYLVDARGSKLTDLQRYLDIEGIRIFSVI